MSPYNTELALENNRRASREAKRRRTGTCEDCGATTRYNGGKGKPVSSLCLSCAAKRSGVAKRGTGPRGQQLLALLDGGPMRFTEIATALGIPNTHMGWLIGRLLEYGLIERPKRGWYWRSA